LLKTVRLCHEVLSLPMSAETAPEQVEITVQSIRRFFSESVSASSLTIEEELTAT